MVRDGAPLPRTAEDDPNLTDEGPQFTHLQQIAGPGVDLVAFDSSHLAHFVVRESNRDRRLVALDVNHPAALIEIHRTPRPLEGVSCRELSEIRCLISEIESKNVGYYTADDPKRLLLVTSHGKVSPVNGPWDTKSLSVPERALSLDGRFIAVVARVGQGKEMRSVTYLHDLDRGTTRVLELNHEHLELTDWDGDALLLESGNRWDETSQRARYRASPDGTLKKLGPITAGIWDEAHRRFFTLEEKKALTIEDRRFVFHADDAHRAVDECCSWVGAQIFFDGDRPAFINPRTLKMKFAADPKLQGGTAYLSTGGRWVIYAADEGTWLSEVRGLEPQ